MIDRFHVDERLAQLCETIAADASHARDRLNAAARSQRHRHRSNLPKTYYSIAENQTVLSLRHAFASAMESASGEVHEREVAAMKYGDDITVDDTHIVDIRRELHARGPVLVGVHNGAAVVPLEIEAGIFENATPALASSVTRGLRSVRFATTRPRCRLPIDVSHRDRRSNALESERGPIHQALPRIEPIVRAFKGIPPRVDLVRLERMTVPMVNPVDSEPPS